MLYIACSAKLYFIHASHFVQWLRKLFFGRILNQCHFDWYYSSDVSVCCLRKRGKQKSLHKKLRWFSNSILYRQCQYWHRFNSTKDNVRKRIKTIKKPLNLLKQIPKSVPIFSHKSEDCTLILLWVSTTYDTNDDHVHDKYSHGEKLKVAKGSIAADVGINRSV